MWRRGRRLCSSRTTALTTAPPRLVDAFAELVDQPSLGHSELSCDASVSARPTRSDLMYRRHCAAAMVAPRHLQYEYRYKTVTVAVGGRTSPTPQRAAIGRCLEMLMMDRMNASASRRITLSNLRPDTVRHSPTRATSDSTRTVCRVSPSCVTRVSRSNFATEIDRVGERENCL
jgi:hypothetical protein